MKQHDQRDKAHPNPQTQQPGPVGGQRPNLDAYFVDKVRAEVDASGHHANDKSGVVGEYAVPGNIANNDVKVRMDVVAAAEAQWRKDLAAWEAANGYGPG